MTQIGKPNFQNMPQMLKPTEDQLKKISGDKQPGKLEDKVTVPTEDLKKTIEKMTQDSTSSKPNITKSDMNPVGTSFPDKMAEGVKAGAENASESIKKAMEELKNGNTGGMKEIKPVKSGAENASDSIKKAMEALQNGNMGGLKQIKPEK